MFQACHLVILSYFFNTDFKIAKRKFCAVENMHLTKFLKQNFAFIENL